MEIKTRERKRKRETIAEAPRCAAKEKKGFSYLCKVPAYRPSALGAPAVASSTICSPQRGGVFITGCKYEQNEDMTKKHDEEIFRVTVGRRR